MPDTDPLSDLRRQLEIAMGPTAAMRGTPWVDPLPMRKVLRDVERHFDRVDAMPQQDTLRTTVQSFLKNGQAANFKELKYTCYGVSLAVDDKHSRLVDQPQALHRLLTQVDGERGEDRRFVRCYQALLQSYFAFTAAPEHSATQMQEQSSFQELRSFLSDRLEVVARPILGRVAGWAITLQEHRNLLTNTPCQRYTDELAQGKTDQLAEVCKGLGVSRESWIWQEVILAYLRDVCQRDDRNFKQSLDQALDLSDGQTALKPSPATSRTVVAQVVKRYSSATEKPELPRLRDASIHWIGNPWLRRPAWDGWVRHEPARQMVDGWLKSKLMEDFFTLLSEKSGGAVDRRRLTYWLKFVDVIEDMWFMLGTDAFNDRSTGFVQMRSRMNGRLKAMTGGPSQNNAFVMRIGGHQFIEFGSKGNACYIYPPDARVFTDQQATIALTALKRGSDRLSHMSDWEWTFDQRMRRIFGRNILSDRPAPTPPPVVAQAPTLDTQQPLPLSSLSAPTTASHSHLTTQTPIPPAPIPRQVRAPDMASFLSECRESGIECRMNGSAVWLSKDAITVPHIAVELAPRGFRYVEDPARTGFWHEREKHTAAAPSQPKLHVRGTDLASFLAACREAGIECKLERNGPATVWMSHDASTIHHIAVELVRLGLARYKKLSGDGFWFGMKEEAATAPSQPVQQPAVKSATMTAQLESIFERCKRLELQYEDHSNGQLHVWIHEDAGQWPTLERTIQSMGFKLVTLGDATGYWLGSPVPLSGSSTTKGASDSDIEATLAACDKLDIKYVDLRDRGGNLWVYTDSTSFPSITERLALQGFCYSEKKAAYWLSGSE